MFLLKPNLALVNMKIGIIPGIVKVALLEKNVRKSLKKGRITMAMTIEEQREAFRKAGKKLNEIIGSTEGFAEEYVEDVVNEPNHYKQGSFEVIDEMIIVFGIENTIQFCRMNAWKYRARAPFKGSMEQDMAKANCYLEMAADLEAIRDKNFELLKEGKLK